MQLNDWQRIEKIVRYCGFSVNAFAQKIGLPRAENLYQIKRGNNGISKQLAATICSCYPEISRIWLLTGDGDMFIGDLQCRQIPCFDADITYLALLPNLPDPQYMVSMPRLGDVDFGAMSLSGALASTIPAGATLFLKRIDVQDIIYGMAYVVAIKQGVLLRIIRVGDGDNGLLLVATNTAYDSVGILREDIVKIYAVRGHLKIGA